ncbi:MAG: PorT family protein [Tannerella sp.]|nr:PorT family protein [Tannerella sp.]
MKKTKWLLCVLAFFIVPVAEAQIRFGVKGGMNIATVKFNKEVANPENITGFQVGPMFEIVEPITGWGIDAAVLYTQKGFEWDDKRIRNDYLEVPVNLKWKIMTPVVKPFVAAGPYVGFRIAGKKAWEVDKLYNDVKGQINAGNFSAGLNFSVGAELLKCLQLSLNYGWGLTDNYKTFEANNPKEYIGKTHTWSMSAAVFF